MQGDLLSLTEAAAHLPHGSRGYLNVLIRRGQLKAEKQGKFWFTRKAWIDEYLDGHPELKATLVQTDVPTAPEAPVARFANILVSRRETLEQEVVRLRQEVARIKQPRRGVFTALSPATIPTSARLASVLEMDVGERLKHLVEQPYFVPGLLGFFMGLLLVGMAGQIGSGAVLADGGLELRDSLVSTATLFESVSPKAMIGEAFIANPDYAANSSTTLAEFIAELADGLRHDLNTINRALSPSP